VDKGSLFELIYHSAGVEADDWLEGAQRNMFRFQGACTALQEAAKDVQALVEGVQDALEKGALDGLQQAQVADFAILQIRRSVDSLINASRHMSNKQLSMQGEIAAYERVVKYFKEKYDDQVKNRAKLEAAIASGEVEVAEDGSLEAKTPAARLRGVRPGPSIAAQRRAEDAAAKVDAEAPVEVPAPAKKASKKVSKEPEVKESPPKKRLRKKKE